MKGQKRPNFKRRYIMRWLLSLIFVMVTLSSAFATETKTEYITEEVCHAVAGCWVDTKTGECPDCVTETRKVVTVIEDESILEDLEERINLVVEERIEEFDEVESHTEISREGGMCFYPKLGWMHHGRATGEWRKCDWDVNYTAKAVERGTTECGGYDNIEWTNSDLTEYVCNEG